MERGWSIEQQEAHVARSLCRALGPMWRFVGNRRPPHPDCLIDGPMGEVAVELVGYHQPGEVNDLWRWNDQFSRHIEEQFGQDPGMVGAAVQFHYRLRRGERYARIPRRSDYASICAETTALVRHARELGSTSIEFSFVESAGSDLRVVGVNRERAEWITSRYPVLGEWFTSVDVRLYVALGIPRASTSLHTLCVGLDEAELVRTIGRHVEKADGYRTATSAPIWLVVHSGGYPVSKSFPSLQAARTIEVARSASTRDGTPVFDGVLWLDRPDSVAAPQLWAVQQPALLSELGIELGVPVSPLDA